jgi:hypothetical protein
LLGGSVELDTLYKSRYKKAYNYIFAIVVIALITTQLLSLPTAVHAESPNDSVVVTVSATSAQISRLAGGAGFFLLYDTDVLDYQSYETLGELAGKNFTASARSGNGPGFGIGELAFTNAGITSVSSGYRFTSTTSTFDEIAINESTDIFKVTFKIKDGTEDGTYPIICGARNTGVGANDLTYFIASVTPSTITIGGSTSPYTITPTGGTSASVGAPFDVIVKLTADPPESIYASAQAELTYDPDLVAPNLESVTPDLATVSEKSDDEPGTLTVVYGPSDGGEVGAGVTLATIPFLPINEGKAVIGISEGATVTLRGQSEDDPDIEAASGKELEVIIAAGSSQPTATMDPTYDGAPSGCALLTYEAAKTVNGYTYDGKPMYWSSKLNAYLYIVDSVEFNAEKIQPGASPADAKELAYDGNLNGGEVRVSDAQIVYDIIDGHANYDTLDGLGVEARLAADVNGDGSVDQDDIDAILNIIHGR